MLTVPAGASDASLVEVVEHVIDLDERLRSFWSLVTDAGVHPRRERPEFPIAGEKAPARDAQREERDFRTISIERLRTRFTESR